MEDGLKKPGFVVIWKSLRRAARTPGADRDLWVTVRRALLMIVKEIDRYVERRRSVDDLMKG